MHPVCTTVSSTLCYEVLLVCSMLTICFSFEICLGFAVGAYVAMASLQKIPNIEKFTLVSCTAAIWGLALTPFFVGFPGSKSTYQIIVQNALQEDLLSCIGVLVRLRY